MDLWFGVIHAAKRSPRDVGSDQSQTRLLRLLGAFKNRPGPAFEEALYPRRDEDWLYDWSEGKLWENLSLFGLAIAESLNDAPDCDSGCTAPEVQAFLNVNVFMARMTVTGVKTRGTWACVLWQAQRKVSVTSGVCKIKTARGSISESFSFG